jgi:membrane protease YdiL (CAAX protease family)
MADPRTDPERFPSVLQAALIVAFLFAAEFLVGELLYGARDTLDLTGDDTSALVTLLGNALVFVWVLRLKGLGYRELFHPARHSVAATLFVTTLPVAMLLPLLVLGMSAAMGLLTDWFPMSPAEQAMFERLGSDSLPSLLTGCVMAPILEEMLFRGVFLRSFLVQYERRGAIVLSALLFGLAHMNLYQFVVGFALGLVTGWLYERTRSLWPTIVLHASYNVSLSVLDAWSRDTAPPPDTGFSDETWLLAAACSFCGVVALRRMLRPRPAH